MGKVRDLRIDEFRLPVHGISMVSPILIVISRGIGIGSQAGRILFAERFILGLGKVLKVGTAVLAIPALDAIIKAINMTEQDVETMLQYSCAQFLDPNEQGLAKYQALRDRMEPVGNQLESLHAYIKRNKRLLNVTKNTGIGSVVTAAVANLMLAEIESHERAMNEIVFGTFRNSGGNDYSTKKRNVRSRG